MITIDVDKKEAVADVMNFYGRSGIPFVFILDFDLQSSVIQPVGDLARDGILFDINGFRNFRTERVRPLNKKVSLRKFPAAYEQYLGAFNQVQKHLKLGDSLLLNLTFPTRIELNLSLKEVFLHSRARYKLLFGNDFTVFSPETFVRIQNGAMWSCPMKGTIDASTENAREKLLANPKELAEHVTIVDLIRNDMSAAAERVYVKDFRYIDEIKTSQNRLLQASSRIEGALPGGYESKVGDIICAMLPAGSVTGAPKTKTVQLIKQIEGYERGYYTGVFGYFDGKNLDSGVMIRFIERAGDQYFFKSGGGVTIYSDPEAEYQELIDKVYVPVD